MNKRKYLTHDEIQRLLQASREGTYPVRDECMIKMCFIHGFRVSELCHLRISDISLEDGIIHVNRLKGGLKTTHPLLKSELLLLKKWLKQRLLWRGSDTPWIFLSQKGGVMSRQQIYKLIRSYGAAAHIPVDLSPHMLRHACGFALADRGADTRLIQDYLGHRNIQHTVLYTSSNSARYIGVWQGDV